MVVVMTSRVGLEPLGWVLPMAVDYLLSTDQVSWSRPLWVFDGPGILTGMHCGPIRPRTSAVLLGQPIWVLIVGKHSRMHGKHPPCRPTPPELPSCQAIPLLSFHPQLTAIRQTHHHTLQVSD